MIPSIFRIEREREAEGQGEGILTETRCQGLKESAFALGFAGAIADYGGFIIPRAYGSSIDATGGPQTALFAFVVYYTTCIVVTWWFYCRWNTGILC
jgi:NNP family nitrate/nitrite transporter-like MFS transporter